MATAALLLTLALSASAHGDWSRSFVATTDVVSPPGFAMSGRHGGLVAWTARLRNDTYEVRVRRVGPRGRFGPVRRASGPIAVFITNPFVAMAPSGAGLVVWARPKGNGHFALAGRPVDARGRLGEARTLVRDVDNLFAEQPPFDLVVDSGGNTIIAWLRSSGDPRGPSSQAIFTRRVSANGSLGPAFELPQDPPGTDFYPTLAAGSSGPPVLLWERWDRSGTNSLWAAPLAADGRTGPLRAISDPEEYAPGHPIFDLDVDARGRATVAWSPYRGGVSAGVRARRLTGDPLEQLTELGGTPIGWQPDVEVHSDGAATVAWKEVDALGSSVRVVARRVSATGRLGALRVLTPWRQRVSDPKVALDGSGTATVTWSEGQYFRARRLGPRGRLSRVAHLSRRGPYYGTDLVLAAGARATLAVWRSGSDVLASRYPTP